MKVLSLFDGISCGQIALNRAGIGYDKYYASEIDKGCIKVTQHNYPNTIQLGDIVKLSRYKGLISNCINILVDGIDLLVGGSPCQGFSFAGKQLNFKDPRSRLFFEFVKIKNIISPKYFLLENVKMKKEYQDVISEYLGVGPISINSALVSAQNRERLYWTNIPNIIQPEDKHIHLSDIIEDDNNINFGLPVNMLNKGSISGRRLNERGVRDDYNKNVPITQCLEIRATNTDKSNCLTTVEKDNVLSPLPIGRYPNAFEKKLAFRYYTLKEYCRLQTVPENYFDNIVPDSRAKKMLGNGWTVDVIAHILSNIK